ncbi:MAG: serine dehydratase subunit alpha family protein [Acutalibacteraceae bacterium]
MEKKIYDAYIDILKEELVPAMGCTEPIAVALAGALARKTLGAVPDYINLIVSGNIIKNVKSVIVPNTNGRKGLQTAVCAGICYGDADKKLQVLSSASDEDIASLDEYINEIDIEINEAKSPYPFDIELTVKADNDTAVVRIVNEHTNVVLIKKNNEILLNKEITDEPIQTPENRKLLSVKKIVEFANEVDIADVEEIIKKQIDYNFTIAKAGLEGHYGAEIGKILLRSYGNAIQNRAKAWAAAGSDARMNGCELPVVINSGSGNQGITASLPVIIYGNEMQATKEQLYRALVVSNLVTIHLKTGIGPLSAYCGATSAGAGAGAGVCYLYGGQYNEIAHTIVNALAINSGMICDGAKASCAAKIASAVEAGLLGMQMYMHDSQFYGGDGIIVKGVENTIHAVSTLAREGMRETDIEIINLMIGKNA